DFTPPSDYQDTPIRVLYVDDEPGFADLSVEYLERANDRIEGTAVQRAAAGLERLEAERFDCIVSDYEMPGRNGIEFLEAVRTDHPELPFILHTGKGSEDIASEAISAGVTDYLQKRGGTDQYAVLANRIENAVDGHQAAMRAEWRRYRLEQVMQTVHASVVQVDPDGEIGVANDRAEAVLGRDGTPVTDRAYGGPDWAVTDLDGDPLPESALPHRRVVSTGEPVRGIEHAIEWPDGTRRAFRVNAAPLVAAAGHVESVICSLLDVTERVASERDADLFG
ncbi:MAG: response regulator, partial [Halobacteriaceae archaeon]